MKRSKRAARHRARSAPPRTTRPQAVRDSRLAVVILAAGQGKRMNSDLPKALQPLAGRPLLQHVIATARTLEASSIHVVYGHGGEQVRESLPSEPVSWVRQAEQLGTGHALLQVAPQLADDEVVLVLYGDVPLLQASTLRRLLELTRPAAVALLTATLEDPSGYGRIVRDSRGRVRRIVEERDATARQLAIHECNTGVLAASGAAMKSWLARLTNHNAQREYYLTDVIAMAVEDRMAVQPLLAPSAAEILGVNDKVQLAQVEAAYRRRQAEELMRAGVTVIDPERLDVRGTVQAGQDVVIDVNVILEGRVTLGDRVRIGPHCVVRDTEIGADTEIFASCVIDHAVIGPRCRIGPFARFRPASSLEQEVHIGNFVEVKNSRIAAGSKANHLTYLGDAVIGSMVNVGAGTVTCNYDGANKSQTHIGDGAFIGSGAMLVAPVRIGAGATIGAGSTITADAPPGQLTLARSRQATIPGWERPKKRPK
ncbi:MAG TPA: bifunctional UDP-N-acetylglucosamine diphosphorylase/glucosamine-1-phosphate N-acetyltransferase GlmU [Steroidobacteraceae bacterium]|nr:bifunctional UDP-N-acetylglucosamine diphosphorylase/glucosamine-1-phosphate N-acetyltransferase GlmU [Steroidobacteraceae bacterium]